MDPYRDIKPVTTVPFLVKHAEIVWLAGLAIDLLGDLPSRQIVGPEVEIPGCRVRYQRKVVGAGRGAQMHLHVVVATCVERIIGRDRRNEKACRVRQGRGGWEREYVAWLVVGG